MTTPVPSDNVPQVALEEVEALKAIYMDDFEEHLVPVKSAWKVAPQREYTIHLVPHGEELKDHASVTLAIRFGRRYPSEPPNLVLRKEKGISDAQLEELQKEVNDYARQLKGQEMIYDIANFIQDQLCRHNSVIRGVKQVSFFEQMQDRREQMDKEEQERALREMEKHRQVEEEAMNEQNMTLASQIQEEIQKKQAKIREERDKRKKSLMDVHPQVNVDITVVPNTPISAPICPNSAQFSLDSIAKGPRVYKGLLSTIYLARLRDQSDTDEECVVLKQIIISNSHYLSGEGKKKLMDSFSELQKLSAIRHPNIVTIYDSKIQKVDDQWQLDILLEHCRGGSLDVLVMRSGGVKLSVARRYMKQILKAVAYLHSQNTIHKDIKSRNVLFTDGKDQDQEVKLSDPLYARRLLDLHKTRKLHPPLPEEKQIPSGWIAPEFLQRPGVYGRRSDIWSLGRTFLEMVLGPVIYEYPSFAEMKDKATGLSTDFLSLIATMLSKDPKDRSTAMELLQHPFFNEITHLELPVALEIMKSSSAVVSPANSFNRRSIPPTTPQKPPTLPVANPTMSQSSIFEAQTLSRYRLDFEEIEFLGKGGFGEVVKARNRIDGRFYAIKKIRLDPKDREGSKRILREVQTLSRLHHQFVVRYYQAWFEDATGETWHDDSEDASDSESEDSDTSAMSGDHDAMGPSFDSDWLSTQQTSKNYPSVSISFGHGADGTTTSSEADHEEESTNNTDESIVSRSHSHRVLYIQMEYCEKKTLRDVIDEGVDDEEGWRLFRQVLEGLAHIHSQGMIHRDLKPSNVFLDGNGNVKIGDFGLALSREDDVLPPKVQVNGVDASADPEASLTGDVGTPVYVAPEILGRKNGKYNSKVDLYSLGICFFEMCYPFSTGMHRAMVLRDLRLPSITFPKDFDFKRYDAQSQIIRMLLNHIPKERPSSLELLQSPLLPPKLEEEFISEALRSIVNQNNPLYYSRLVTSLFAQSTDRHKDFTYEFNSSALNVDQLVSLVTSRMYAHCLSVFSRHGAIQIRSPLLMPKGAVEHGEYKKVVELVDGGGCVVQLPYDLTVGFARLVSRVSGSLGRLPLKRWCVESVYRRNTVGGQPRTVLECDFDIVTPNLGHMCPDAEVFKVVFELLEFSASKYTPPSTHFEIRLNHCSILDVILDTAKIPTESRLRKGVYDILEQLDKPMNWAQIRGLILGAGVGEGCLGVLEKFYRMGGTFEDAVGKVESLVDAKYQPAVKDIVAQLRLLTTHLHHLGIRNRVLFIPLLSYNTAHYKSGLIFQVCIARKKRVDVVAAGGRYDSLLTHFRYPFGPMKKLHAVGVHLALSKVVSAVVSEQAEMLRHSTGKHSDAGGLASHNPLFRRADVLVASFGGDVNTFSERLGVVSLLWSAGIAADVEYGEVVGMQEVIQRAEAEGYVVVVLIKHHSNKSGVVKVRNLEKKTEVEVGRGEVVAVVAEQLGTVGEGHVKSGEDVKVIGGLEEGVRSGGGEMAVVQAPWWKRGKVKHKDKLVVLEKASSAINSTLSTLSRSPIFAVDLPISVLQRLSETELDMGEEQLKKVFEGLNSNQREYLCTIKRQILRHVRDLGVNGRGKKGKDGVWLYSMVDFGVVLYSFG